MLGVRCWSRKCGAQRALGSGISLTQIVLCSKETIRTFLLPSPSSFLMFALCTKRDKDDFVALAREAGSSWPAEPGRGPSLQPTSYLVSNISEVMDLLQGLFCQV
jgi:hypothetical protein